MVSEVNNLIINTLITKREVLLPGIGVLFLRRVSAVAEADVITPPSYCVDFSSHRTACCLVDIIAEAAEISVAEAEDIYTRWRDKVQMSGNVVISGVGELRGKTFITDAAFLLYINGDTDKPIKITAPARKSRGWLLVLLFLLPIVLVSIYFLADASFGVKSDSIVPENDVKQTAVIKSDTLANESLMINVEEPTEKFQSSDEPLVESVKWYELPDIRHRVVVGSYSTLENAERAARDIERDNTEIYCSIFELGKMYAVAVYGSSEHADCAEFKRDHAKLFPQSWIHTPKRFK